LFAEVARLGEDRAVDHYLSTALPIAALVTKYRLPADAAFGLFATARSVGLIAHGIEQLGVGQVIRPRGRYIGILPP
jgi:citrate synthase